MGQLVDHPVDHGQAVPALDRREPAVVPDHQVEGRGHPVDQLGGLQADQPAVVTQLDQVALHLLGDAQEHLGRLDHADHVAHRHRVLHLEHGQARQGHVEPAAEALHGGQGLVGAVVEPAGGLHGVLEVVAVDGDDRHGRRHRQDRHVDGPGHPLGRPVPGAGLGGGDGGLGHQVDIGPGDPGGVGGQDDGAVHLGQLREPLGAELGVEQEAARADGEHAGTVPHHDQGAPLGPQDAVQPVPQRAARGGHGQGVTERRALAGGHRRMVPGPVAVGPLRGRPGRLSRSAPSRLGQPTTTTAWATRVHPDQLHPRGPVGGRRRHHHPVEAQTGRTPPAAGAGW